MAKSYVIISPMSYEITKIALLVLMCIPLALLAFSLAVNVFNLNISIRKKKKLAQKKSREEELRRINAVERRRYFDEEYDKWRGGYYE